MMSDQDYMQRTLGLAVKARGMTSPNPMVGAIVVKEGRMIAEGWHHRCGGAHAEVLALKKAGRQAQGARLFVNLEPCFHYGHTPPCVDFIIQKGVKEVVIGMKDPNPLTGGKSILKLKRAGVKVKVGVLKEQAQVLNEHFVRYITSHKPFVAAKSALTLDGKIATAKGSSQWITSQAARTFAYGVRGGFDAIMVGIGTVLADNPRLNARQKGKKLKKVVLDSGLRISTKARLFQGVRPSDCIVATTKKAPARKIKLLQKRGITVIVCPGTKQGISLKWLLKQLARHQITSVLIEGGAHVIGRALKDNLVDKMYVYLAPKIIGDQKALSAVVGVNTPEVSQAIGLKDITHEKIGKDILITGYVYRNH